MLSRKLRNPDPTGQRSGPQPATIPGLTGHLSRAREKDPPERRCITVS